MATADSDASGAAPRVLVVDDDPDIGALLEVELAAAGYAPVWKQSAEAALDHMGAEEVDVVVTDLSMPGMNGLELTERVAANRPDIPVVVMTAHASVETAIAAIRVGADDFITKPLQADAVRVRLARVVGRKRLREEVVQLREVVDSSRHFGDILGESRAMRRVYDLLARIADSEASVLITGESGTGKELVARALHERSRRRGGEFVAVNCSAVPEPLLESELFGHARGAFTDARSDRPGLFARASGGTLFLDEIGDMPLGLQPKLLRALQERVVRPVGSDAEVPIDVRIVAATNRDLEGAVADGRFREDLFFRINVIQVELPPLRARGRDVLVLAQSFLDRFARQAGKKVTGFSAAAAEKLLAYEWPGNVRELQNCVERAVALARYAEIAVDDLPEKVRSYERSHVIVASDDPTELVPMETVESRYIARVMEAVGGNKTLAAKTLGFDRKTLYRKLDRYGITVAQRDDSQRP